MTIQSLTIENNTNEPFELKIATESRHGGLACSVLMKGSVYSHVEYEFNGLKQRTFEVLRNGQSLGTATIAANQTEIHIVLG